MKYSMTMVLLALSLNASVFSSTLEALKKHEGFSHRPYQDTPANWSIGYGTNIAYITEVEASLLLSHRLGIIQARLENLKWYTNLSDARKEVILNMTYNLGINGILSFRRMIWCLSNNRTYYHAAANAMKNSLWCRQVGNRCNVLSNKMWHGKTNK